MFARIVQFVFLAISVIGGGLIGLSALGGIERPNYSLSAASRVDYLPELKSVTEKSRAQEEIRANQRAARMAIFSKFRPVGWQREDGILDMDPPLVKTFFSNFFNKELTAEMKARYQGGILPLENKVNSPYRKARNWEMEQYDSKRNELANWAAKEVLDNKLKELFRGADQDSSAMQVIGTMRELTGGAPLEEKTQGQQEKGQQKKETKRSIDHSIVELPKPLEEERIPTKLKTRFNVVKRAGQLNFINPIVVTEMNLNLAAEDKLTVKMKKEFKKLKMNSNAEYAVKRGILKVNVSKTITNRISLDVESHHYTGEVTESSGKRSHESARLNYSLSF